MNILGLDISTSVIGICVLTKRKRILCLDYINLTKTKNFWDKIEQSKQKIHNIFEKYKIEHVVIEEPLKRARRGKSNINTIVLLQRFNAIISYICKEKSNIEPVWISALNARKSCDIKLESKKKSKGKTHKEQTFEQVLARFLKRRKWDKTRNGTHKPYNFDMVDAYVISRAFLEKDGKN